MVVGAYLADLLVDVLPVELKNVKALGDMHRMQCTNYLNAAGLAKSRPEIRRVSSSLP